MSEATEPQKHYDDAKDEISLLDIGVAVVRNRSLIVRATALFAVIGLVLALSAAPVFQSSMTVMSELGSEGASAGGLGSALRSFGLSLPGAGTGGTLSAQAIPDIVASRQVRLAVAQDTFYFPELEREATLVDYMSRDPVGFAAILGFVKRWTIGLPGMVLSLFRSEQLAGDGRDSPFLTEEEEAALEWLSGAISTSEDLDSGLITISATADDPVVAAQLVLAVAEKLRARVQMVYTNKTRQNLQFVEGQFQAAGDELGKADRMLADFQDSNQGLNSSRGQLDGQRLQRDVNFKAQLYTELQAQRTQAQIELQKSEPVITTIEEPVPPRRPSGPNRALTLVLWLIMGGMTGVGLAFVSTALERGPRASKDQSKLAEIQAAMPSIPGWLRRR